MCSVLLGKRKDRTEKLNNQIFFEKFPTFFIPKEDLKTKQSILIRNIVPFFIFKKL